MTFRKTIFWIHLVSGLVAGIVIAIMSVTGIAIAFEHEILDWIDRDVSQIASYSEDEQPLPVEELRTALTKAKPDFKATTLLIPNDPETAYTFRAGRSGAVFVNQYTGEVRELESTSAHNVLHTLEDWHRWLGMKGEGREIGKLINGICNLAFLFLCLSGLYLWFPRKWSWRAVRPILWFVGKYKGKARDFNWHNVFGFWSLPVLTVLVATAVVFSFGWAHKLVYTLSGEEAPVQRGPGILAGAPVEIPEPEPGQEPVTYDAVIDELKKKFPTQEAIGIDFPRPSQEVEIAPLNFVVFEPAPFSTRGRIQLAVDPYRGDILQKVGFEDRTRGTRARIWVRFLHTGEAFGLFGKIVATIATAASLFLVYTGFALSWRRFFVRSKRTSVS